MSDSFIIAAFPRYAGGKFITNCLSLSRFCCPQDPVSAEYLLKHPTDYNYRINAAMRTLPPDRTSMVHWIPKFEFGDNQLYMNSFDKWINGINDEPGELVRRLLDSDLRLFLTAHDNNSSVRNLVKVWPNSTIIKLINHSKFSKISQSLKSMDSDNNDSVDKWAGNYCKSKYTFLAGSSWPSWEEFESVGYDIRQLTGFESVTEEILSFYNCKDISNTTFLFDVDGSFFNRDNFLKSLKRLYEQLEFDDFNSDLVGKFWQAYIELHVDNVNLVS